MRRVQVLAGMLNERVRFERRVELEDAAGQAVRQWELVADVWCRVRGANGREMEAAAAMNSEVSGVLDIRWMPGLSAGMRAVITTRMPMRVLELTGDPVDLDGRRWSLSIPFREGMTEG